MEAKVYLEGVPWVHPKSWIRLCMEVFLSARAEEIVPGGLIVLVLPAIPSEIQYSKIGYRIFTLLESSLIDMVNEGIVEESRLTHLIFQRYFPSSEDMTKVVEKNGCFSIERMAGKSQSGIDANSFINHIRAGSEEMFTIHFGSKIAEEMFERTLEKIEEISAWLEDEYCKTKRQLFLVLKSKINL
ncbi:hypothetical protein H5410_052034 [Solanum commersonii]|uniref:Uncharacterized protein n=1 Tax=Solanum commersonii TaxID=4109 RepID=A0A9J5X148_SOLCO|nr:hypothetical protein H5410_052034 [Solanum commersonii]